jgi:hypothetical protein
MKTVAIGGLCFFLAASLGSSGSAEVPAAGIQFRLAARFGVQEATTKEEEPYQFSSIRNIEIDQAGNIYVLDAKDACVKVFDQSGKFIKKMFSPGKGPQEISDPYYLKINKFSGNLYAVQEHGYQIKEFDTHGAYLKTRMPPAQIFYDFEFLDAGRAVFIVDAPQKTDLSSLLVYNLETSKTEKELGSFSVVGMSRAYQRLVLKERILWTCPGDNMELLGFDTMSGKKVAALPIPEKYRGSEIVRGQNMQAVRLYNFGQPFLIDGRLFVCVTHQDFPPQADRPWHPKSRSVTLYLLEKHTLQKVAEFPSYGFLADVHAAWRNRLVISSSGFDLYPQVLILELVPAK